jgi:hypothetical protein
MRKLIDYCDIRQLIIGHGQCIDTNTSAPYCICDSGWNGNGDWATRTNDCHINAIANAVIWSITTLLTLTQIVIGTRRVYQWLMYRSRHASLHHHSLMYMLVHDQSFRITIFIWIHSVFLGPLSALHLWENGPRISKSYIVTILYAICYYFLIAAVYSQGITTFTLSVRIASPIASQQDELLQPMVRAARFTVVILLLNFGLLPLISCAAPQTQDIITQTWIAAAFVGALVVGVTFAVIQYRVTLHLLDPTSLTTLNDAQRGERHRVANGIRKTIKMIFMGIGVNGSLIIAVLFWRWARSHMEYW